MRQFLAEIFQDAVSPDRQLAVFSMPGQKTRRFAELAPAVGYATSQAQSSDVYFGVGLISGDPRGRGKFEDVAGIGCLWADIDFASTVHPNPSLPAGLEDARWILDQMPLPASIVVHSGHGVHAYWLLHEPWIFEDDASRKSAARIAKGWHGLVCKTAAKRGWSLENLGDLTRVLRLPGTINHRDAQNPAAVELIDYAPDHRFAADDFEPFLPTEAAQAERVEIADLVLQADAQPPLDKLIAAAAESPQFKQAWDRQRADLADQSQSAYDLSLATVAALRGWSDQEIANLIIAARRHHNERPEKALRADYIRRTLVRAKRAVDEPADDVDISALVPRGRCRLASASATSAPDKNDVINVPDADATSDAAVTDPGGLPPELLDVPGFVADVMDYTLSTAPYPNRPLAFVGALALQAVLAGRKIREPGNLRTNLMLLALAHSGVGKDWPRKVNARILLECGEARKLAGKSASGEGIEDRLIRHPIVLKQDDEVDTMFANMADNADPRYRNQLAIMLELYGEAGGWRVVRDKADRQSQIIHQPHLVLFGTTTPAAFYESMSARLLNKGMLGRLTTVEADSRQRRQRATWPDLPTSILQTAKWWSEFRPPNWGNLSDESVGEPRPLVVSIGPAASAAIDTFADECDQRYHEAEQRNDEAVMAIWARALERATQLALVYACSAKCESPEITLAGVRWASDFVRHSTLRTIFMLSQHFHESDFEGNCNALYAKLDRKAHV